MRIAILGAGFSGLATAWYLLKHTQGSIKIDLYDPFPLGGGVSGLSSGLLHPFGGKHAKISWRAKEGIDSMHQLLTEATIGANQPLILSKGIFRPAVTEEQYHDFKLAAQKYSLEAEWWEREESLKTIPGLALPQDLSGGLFVKNGLTIDVQAYIQGLWQRCARLGCQFHQTAVISQKEMAPYDHIVFALGYAVKFFKPLSELPISPLKGQILELKWPSNVPPLPFSLVSQGYLVMGKDQQTCMAGTTYERDFSSPAPDPTFAEPEIKKKITPFFPSIEKSHMITCRAGIRASSSNHLPVLGRALKKYWFFTGLGSKGLLYHSWLGEILAQAILNKDLSLIPKEVLYQPE